MRARFRIGGSSLDGTLRAELLLVLVVVDALFPVVGSLLLAPRLPVGVVIPPADVWLQGLMLIAESASYGDVRPELTKRVTARLRGSHYRRDRRGPVPDSVAGARRGSGLYVDAGEPEAKFTDEKRDSR
jgi:hypothetical protein